MTFQRPMFLAGLILALLPLLFAYRSPDYGRNVSILHFAVIVLLALSAAAPAISVQEERQGGAELVVLKDDSLSASFMDYSTPELEDVRVREKVIASGNSSDIASGIRRNLEEDTSYLLASDLQTDGDIASAIDEAGKKNSTVHLLKPEMREEKSVSIHGPGSTVPGAENKYTVEVSSTNNEAGQVTLYRDSREIFSGEINGSKTFNMEFEDEGTHTLRAELAAEDEWASNNRFYTAVDVTEKPEILVVGQRGELGDRLEEFYDVSYSDTPENLEDYYSVILKKSVGDRELVEYVSEGNGLVYTGNYGSDMSLLPVRKDEGTENENARIILLIDISKSTEEDIDRSKDIAYALVDELPANAKVGAVAYSREPYRVSEPRILAYSREGLKQKISRLPTRTLSYHDRGLKTAKEMADGEGNIIMMTDGRFSSGVEVRESDEIISESISTAEEMDARLFTLGIGDANRPFLRDLARRTDGYYKSAEHAGELSLVFKSGGGAGEVLNMVKANSEHFITGDLEVEGQLALYDSVSVKRGGNVLVASASGSPVLTTWRYGIGRVASFSADSTDLEGTLREEPALVSRTVSWSVGDPERKKERWLDIESTRRGEEIKVSASYPVEGLKRQGENLYTGRISPEETGLHTFSGKDYAYNYREELEGLGYDEKKVERIESQGSVYSSSSMEDLEQEVEKFSSRKVETSKALSPYLLSLAMILFLIEVGYRKRKGKR